MVYIIAVLVCGIYAGFFINVFNVDVSDWQFWVFCIPACISFSVSIAALTWRD